MSDRHKELHEEIDYVVQTLNMLRAENAELQKTINNCNADWAEDHTQLQNLCIQAGISPAVVNGDSYGVPGIVELAEMLAKEVAALRAELAPLRETVGVASTASTCAADLSNWSKLVERADNSTRLERENTALRITHAQDKENYQCSVRAAIAVEEKLKVENTTLREKIAVLGEIALANWDDKTVGECDAITKDPLKYKDVLRQLFIKQRKELAALRTGVDTALRLLSTCIHDRWDEAHVENAYFALKAIDDTLEKETQP